MSDSPPPPKDAEPDPFLAVARVVAAHGIKGEARCAILTDFPERFRKTRMLFLGAERRRFEVEQARLQRGSVLIKLAGVDDRAAAEHLRGVTLYVPEAEAVILPEGSYFWHQIIGLQVQTVEGSALGQISEILETGSNDVYVVQGPRGELLLPAIRDVIQNVDLERGLITVALMEGLV